MLSQYRLLRRIARFGRLRRLLSTRAHPLQVALVDGTLVGLVVTGGTVGLHMYDMAQLSDGSYNPYYGATVAIGVTIGLLAGFAAAIFADSARRNPHLIRSAWRTAWWTLVVVIAPVLILWLGFALIHGDPLTLRGLLGVLVVFGPAMAPLGYRWLGFRDCYPATAKPYAVH